MVLYGMSLSILAKQIRGEYPRLLHSWYSDDFVTAGAGAHIKPSVALIEALGPVSVLFVKPDKSQFLISPGVSEEASRAFMAPLEFIHRGGGGGQIRVFLGSDETNIYGWSRRWKLG